VSLLLDALKRAEQEKSVREGGGGAAASEASPPPRAGGTVLELQPVNNAHAGISATRAGDAHGAQTLFDAKAAANRAAETRAKGPLLAAIGAIAIIVLAAGAYVWFSIQSLTPRAPVLNAPPRPPAAPTPPPAAGIAPSVASAPSSVSIVSPVQPAAPAPLPAPRENPVAEAAQRRVLELLREPPKAAGSNTGAASAAPAPAAVQLERSVEKARIPADVAGGYDALRSGDLAESRRRYEAALAADATSVDAHLGLATVEARAGRPSAAALYYRKALQLDPRNATAVAGLAALADFSRADDLETQLRSDLARHPGSAALHATLGNLYASQSRWTEAQAAYFEAHRLQPASADTLYNLAVSLDHLGQARLAADYYGRALEAARGQSAQFDAARASRRLAELQR
jgi:tetratricopeptide (TPR) repeat protein